MNIFKLIKTWVEDILVPESKRIKKLLAIDSGALRSLLPKSPVSVDNLDVLFNYDNNLVKLIVRSIKYKNNQGLRKRVAEYLYDEIMEMSADIALFSGQPPLVVPMPMSKKEKQKKGFNQCEELLKEVKRFSDNEIQISFSALRKVRETERQTTLSRDERITNVRQSMWADPLSVKGQPVIVFDDVYTTLSTFREAERALLTAGAKRTIGLFVAH